MGNGKRKIENYKTELEEKWIGAMVNDRDYGVVEITHVTITTEYWDEKFGICEDEVEFGCYDEFYFHTVTFDLNYAEENLVEEEVVHG